MTMTMMMIETNINWYSRLIDVLWRAFKVEEVHADIVDRLNMLEKKFSSKSNSALQLFV